MLMKTMVNKEKQVDEEEFGGAGGLPGSREGARLIRAGS